MSDATTDPADYRVSYSGRVREELTKLIDRAREAGHGPEVLAALKSIDHRLRVYPQFGQPLRDLKLEPVRVWVACVPPLTVQYVLDEERRQVSVVVPIVPLPKSGF
jgi:hypothetical protein